MATVRKIEKRPAVKKKLRVAAYARVSSDKDAMLHSLSAQVSYYSKLIQSNRDWEFVGVYTDEGLTGTKDNRNAFVQMLDDARAGKIDLIITKAISRFARNTVTTLQVTRELKSLGVDVFFEEQNLHTISEEGEFMLTVIASIAQEESRQVSENQKWRIKRDFEQGIPWCTKACYGYKLINRKHIVVPEEAKWIKKMYEWYLAGDGYVGIAKKLNEAGSRTREGALWKHCGIALILRNITYTGCLLLQKTYSLDYLTKTKCKNNGERQMYYVEDAHEPIVSMETFKKVEEIRQQRHKQYSGWLSGMNVGYPLAGMLVCGKCGRAYAHKVTRYNKLWICTRYNTLGKSYCDSRAVPERALYDALNAEFGYTEFDETDFKRKVKKVVVQDNNALEIHFKSGEVKTIFWITPSRSNSWTPEMKAKAAERLRARYRR